MRLKLDQLDAQLRKGLLPVYLVTGDEPLLCQEALDTLRATARQQGFDTREVFHAEAGFRSDDFLASALSLSLFGDRKLLELRLPGGSRISMNASAANANERSIGFQWSKIDFDSFTHLKRLIELNIGDPELMNRELSALG